MAAMTKAEKFFYDNGGWSYNPETETPEGGRRRTASEMAAAEAWARQAGVNYVWEYDDDSSGDGDETPHQVREMVAVYLDGEIIASLASVGDATPEYRRVIEAEMALEGREVVGQTKAHAAMIAPVLDDLKAARAKLDRVIGGTLPAGASTRPRLPYIVALKEAADALQRARMLLGGITRLTDPH